jgi:hypothetical protein
MMLGIMKLAGTHNIIPGWLGSLLPLFSFLHVHILHNTEKYNGLSQKKPWEASAPLLHPKGPSFDSSYEAHLAQTHYFSNVEPTIMQFMLSWMSRHEGILKPLCSLTGFSRIIFYEILLMCIL